MNPILKNILAVILGWLGGSAINMGLIQMGFKLFPILGVDPKDIEALAEVMPTLEFEYFIFPFLAHALGTFVGAIICVLIVTKHKMKFSLGFGVLSLLGGAFAAFLLSAPTWFVVTDIILAYIPMAWLGGKIAMKFSKAK